MTLSIASTTDNLEILSEYLRRDPESYRDEFLQQFEHFLQLIKLLDLDPSLHRSNVEQLLRIVNFLTTVAFFYSDESKKFGKKLTNTLLTKAEEIGHELRLSFCKAIVALRSAERMPLLEVVGILFYLLKCEDKQLRKFIKSAVLSIIKQTKINSKSQKKIKKKKKIKSCSISTSLSISSSKLQSFIFEKINDLNPTSARVAQFVLINSYRKGFWQDAKTANLLSECVFHKIPRIQLSTIRFFLGSIDEEDNSEDDSESENEKNKDSATLLRDAVQSFKYAKKTKKRNKELLRAKKEIGKSQKLKKNVASKFCNMKALMAIYDPQKFADRLFGSLESKKNEKFQTRLLQIALCARVIGLHRLQTLGFYSYIQRYIQPKQREVTRILLYAAQACHELVPPDLIENLVRKIAQSFVTDQNTSEAITVGLNTIREIFCTCPAAATEELLRDLTEVLS